MKNSIKYLLITLAVVSISKKVDAQLMSEAKNFDMTIILDRNIESEKYSEAKGSAYLLKDWSSGEVKTVDQIVKKDLMLKYDQIADELLIKGEGNTVRKYSSPVSEFTIMDGVNAKRFVSGFAKTKTTNEGSYFEVVTDGKVKFLRRNVKTISENKEYSGNIAKTVIDGISYYLVIANNEPVPVKLDQKAILALLGNKQTELTAYIATNKLNLKKPIDAGMLISYYNTLN